MQSIALLLQLDDTSFSQHILVVGIEDELVLMDSFLSNSNQPSLLVTRILHRLLSIQDMCVVESSHFLSISRFVGICECYKVEPLILNLIPSLFEKNNGLLTDYLRMIQTSTIILDSLVRTIEYLSCGKVKGNLFRNSLC